MDAESVAEYRGDVGRHPPAQQGSGRGSGSDHRGRPDGAPTPGRDRYRSASLDPLAPRAAEESEEAAAAFVGANLRLVASIAVA
jgi:hypothetical protein